MVNVSACAYSKVALLYGGTHKKRRTSRPRIANRVTAQTEIETRHRLQLTITQHRVMKARSVNVAKLVGYG